MHVKPTNSKAFAMRAGIRDPISSYLQVWDPERSCYLPEEGADVPNNTYWKRQIQSGAVEVAAQAAAKAKSDSTPAQNP